MEIDHPFGDRITLAGQNDPDARSLENNSHADTINHSK
jgi:hypothetical protein